MTNSRMLRLAAGAAAALALAALPAAAQAHTPAPHAAPCDRIATTSFTFGRTGGNIRPSGLRIDANGAVSPVDDTTGTAHAVTVSTRALRSLARRAWTGPFVRLAAAPTKFRGLPDVARKYVDLHSACGTKHVESESGYQAPAFREIYSRLETLTRPK